MAVNGRLTISSLTVLEIVKGLHKADRREQLERFVAGLSSIEVLALDCDAALIAGRIHADLERSGMPIGRADPMIAAIAIRHEMTLVTGNTDHFGRIRSMGYELKFEDWRTA
jgi:tRNA(fMet)-specific endonuclease VapC